MGLPAKDNTPVTELNRQAQIRRIPIRGRKEGIGLTKDPGSRRAAVILFGLCVIAAGAIAGAAVYRYGFWGDQLPGGFAVSAVDLNGDGHPEYVVAKVLVDLPESGDYTAVGILSDPATGAALATTTGRVEMDRGSDVFGIGFWAPDVRKAQVSGPYTVRLTLIREPSDSAFERPASPDMVGRVYQWSHSTPAYDWRAFQEQPADLTISSPVASEKLDTNGDGLAESYVVTVPISVRKAGVYVLRAETKGLSLPGVTDRFGASPGADLTRPQFIQMNPGDQRFAFSVPSDQMYLSGANGPMEFQVRISSANERVTTHPCCGTPDTTFTEDPAFAPPPDGSVFGLRAPYLIAPTPVGVQAETRFTEVVHWYDFQAPWMPISFTGTVRDRGTDLDGNGKFDALTVEADVNVRALGSYDLSGTLYAAGSEPSEQVLMRSTPAGSSVVTTAWTRISFNDWSQTNSPQTVRLDFSGAELLKAGVAGPYDVKLRIVPANVIIDPIVAHATTTYTLDQFEATGAKASRVPGITIASPEVGAYSVSVDASGVPAGYTVMVRIIHANGVVASEGTFTNGAHPSVFLRTDSARAGDFAVAVYLMSASGAGVDYIEVPLA